MNYIQRAIKHASALERNLQSLITEASTNCAYDDVAKLAGLASSLRQMFASALRAENSLAPPSDAGGPVKPSESKSLAAANGKTAEKYPYFETDPDRLIKVGWSKKTRSTYEHKASLSVCKFVSLKLAEVGAGNSFKMDDFVGLVDVDSQEIPSYQSYLVLAWLRWSGLVEKDSKEGYVWSASSFGAAEFKVAWSNTPIRKEGK